MRLNQIPRPERVPRTQPDELAVLLGRQAVRASQVHGRKRAKPSAAEMTLHAALVAIKRQLSPGFDSSGLDQWRVWVTFAGI